MVDFYIQLSGTDLTILEQDLYEFLAGNSIGCTPTPEDIINERVEWDYRADKLDIERHVDMFRKVHEFNRTRQGPTVIPKPEHKQMVLKKDLLIPAGTVFTNIGDTSVMYGSDVYEADFGLTNDTAGSVVYSMDWSVSDAERKQLLEFFLLPDELVLFDDMTGADDSGEF